MKKKIAIVLMFLFSCLTIFTGCNLFDTNNYAGLNSIVAVSGDIEITREQLLTAYNSSGYYYDNYYGYTREEALKLTIKDLINREVLLRYIDELAKTDARYELTDAEEYSAIKETWDYIDSSIEAYIKEVRKDLGLTTEELDEEETEDSSSEYSAKEVYVQKFEKDDEGRILRKQTSTNSYVPEGVTIYNYKTKISATNKDYETLVWNRYLTDLKISQKNLGYKDLSDTKVFNRELERVHKTNIENAKLEKFQNIYQNNFGADYDSEDKVYYLNEKTLSEIVEKYAEIYSSNKELYNISYSNNNYVNLEDDLNLFYNTVTNSTSRKDYFFYGSPTDDEKLLTCMHILVKISDKQTENIKKYQENPLLQDYADELVKLEKSQAKTMATERDSEGKEITGNTISVEDLYNALMKEINDITLSEGADGYLEAVVSVFDKYIYKYNQDSGIMNAKFDYVVGTKTSGMVKSFTEVVRTLYNDGKANYSPVTVTPEYNQDIELYFPNGVGYAGAISQPFLEEASNYSGYHIVLYTGTLKNVVADNVTTSNVYEKLSQNKTSIAYNQDLFEYLFDMVAKDNYSKYQKDVINSLSKDIKFNTNRFSDLY